MAVFSSKKFQPSSQTATTAARFRVLVAKHPFLLFGLPFMATIVAGSFVLTPATAIRYERHDRKVKQLTQGEGLGLGQNKRKVDLQEEYFRLAGKDLNNWEQKRVKRLPGEPDGILE